MKKEDFDDFAGMLDAVCSLLSRGQYAPSPTNSALWFRSLADHSLEAVRHAFDAHVKDPQRGRFVPVPADILAQLTKDGRPGADEAWPIALQASDERSTVVWTSEIQGAWAIAKPVLDAGDKIGARMAFRDAYERLCSQAKGRVVWCASLGHDEHARRAALTAAVECGRLSLPYVAGYLSPPDDASAMSPNVAKVLRALRDEIAARNREPEATDAEIERQIQSVSENMARAKPWPKVPGVEQ